MEYVFMIVAGVELAGLALLFWRFSSKDKERLDLEAKTVEKILELERRINDVNVKLDIAGTTLAKIKRSEHVERLSTRGVR